MLTREVMGLVALGILWVNTLLIAAAAAKGLGALLEKRRALRPLGAGALGEGVLRGRVARGDGPGGALACQRIRQIGRSAGESPAGPRIIFSDRESDGEIFGGAIDIEVTPGTIESIEIAPSPSAEVWIADDARRAAAARAEGASFDEAYEDARKARGFSRSVIATIEPGQEAWTAVFAAPSEDGAPRLGPPPVGPRLISTVDPGPFLARKIALSVASIVAMIALCAALSAVALYPPRFGLISTIGGALCFAFFLLVQPAGTALRDAVLLPHRAPLRGTWRRNS